MYFSILFRRRLSFVYMKEMYGLEFVERQLNGQIFIYPVEIEENGGTTLMLYMVSDDDTIVIASAWGSQGDDPASDTNPTIISEDDSAPAVDTSPIIDRTIRLDSSTLRVSQGIQTMPSIGGCCHFCIENDIDTEFAPYEQVACPSYSPRLCRCPFCGVDISMFVETCID